MDYRSIEILEWVKSLHYSDLNDLGSSGMEGVKDTAELGLDINPIPISSSDHTGYKPLKELLTDRYRLPYENITLTPGASMANFMVMSILLSPGDQVAIEYPTYNPLVDTAFSLTQREPVRIIRNPKSFRLDEQSFKDLPAPVKLIILTNPHNPSGMLDNDNILRYAAEQMHRRDGRVLVDEIFRSFFPGGDKKSAAGLHDRIITTNSLTKVWGLSNLRAGWIFADKSIIGKLVRFTNHLYVHHPFIAEYMAFRILSDKRINELLLSRAQQRAAQNKEIVHEFFTSQPALEWTEPDGGIISIVKVKNSPDSSEFCRTLLENYKTMVMPGRFFGLNNCFRLGFGADSTTLKRGLDAISNVLSNK